MYSVYKLQLNQLIIMRTLIVCMHINENRSRVMKYQLATYKQHLDFGIKADGFEYYKQFTVPGLG